MNLEFELKCAVGLPGYFAGTFSGTYICLDLPPIVDSSFVLILFTLLCMPALAGTKRQLLLTEYVIHSLDFALDIRSPAKLTTHLANLCMHNIASSKKSGGIVKQKCLVVDYAYCLEIESPRFHTSLEYTTPLGSGCLFEGLIIGVSPTGYPDVDSPSTTESPWSG